MNKDEVEKILEPIKTKCQFKDKYVIISLNDAGLIIGYDEISRASINIYHFVDSDLNICFNNLSSIYLNFDYNKEFNNEATKNEINN